MRCLGRYHWKEGSSAMNFLKLFAKHRVWFILLGILVVTILMSPNFLTVRNISNVLLQTSINGIIALGMTFLLISGDFDLSVGSVMALSAALAIGLQSRGILTACIIAVVLGSAIGLLNGFLVTKAKINAFIVTLGTMTMVRGIVLAYTNQRPISGTNSSFLNLSGSSWLGIPIPAFIFFAGVIVSHIILTYNSLGRNCFAIGGNREASIFSGIRVDRYRIIYFTICSFTAAIAGIVLASRLNTASPVYGQDTALMVVAAVLLGGTSLAGGSGSVIQTLAGVMIIGVLNNSLNLMNVFSYYQGLIIGIILVVVTILDSYYAKKRKFEAQIITKRLEFKKELNKGT